jgi:Fur family ferric uptake transcriptional regulator
MILECIKEKSGEHMTAEDITDALKAKKMRVAKSTVYRYLGYLEDVGLVKKYIISEQQPACYQYLGNDEACLTHFHLMCQACSQIEHFENDMLQILVEDIKNKDGFFIDGRKTVFYGMCKSCTKV